MLKLPPLPGAQQFDGVSAKARPIVERREPAIRGMAIGAVDDPMVIDL